MLKRTVVVAMLLQGVLSAQDIAGDWQGTLNFGKTERRVVITIVKAAGGGLTATELTPDEGSNGVMANSVTFEASTLKLAFDAIRATYEGTLSDGGNSLQGTLTQGSRVPPQSTTSSLTLSSTEMNWIECGVRSRRQEDSQVARSKSASTSSHPNSPARTASTASLAAGREPLSPRLQPAQTTPPIAWVTMFWQ